MTPVRLIALLATLVFGGMLAWGLKTGIMPLKQASVDRREHPIQFWIGAAMYGSFCLFGLYSIYIG